MLDFLKLKKSIQDVNVQANSLRQTIEEKKQRRDFLETAPLSRNELAEKVCEMIDAHGAQYPERLSMALEFSKFKPLFDFKASNLALVNTTGGGATEGQLPKVNAYWIFADLYKQRLSDAIDVMDWPDNEVGPPLAERQTELKKLDKEIMKLEGQLQDIRQSAEQAGIHIERVDPIPTNKEMFRGGRPLNGTTKGKQ